MTSETQPHLVQAGPAPRRFIAPQRGGIEPDRFDHPVFSAHCGQLDWLRGERWPTVDAMTAALRASIGPDANLQFVAQSQQLLRDGLHYEERIRFHERIATRPDNWHDLFNALIWIRHTTLKRALNGRQVEEIGRVGQKHRSRAQSALTHFDEGGAIVVVRDPRLVQLWDAHDWHGLFWRERSAWGDGRIGVAAVIGHALLEQALQPEQLLVAKCIAVATTGDAQRAVAVVSEAIASGALLGDPQELRPLPLSGIPGWHAGCDSEDFYRQAACFRPVREGRHYPPPHES